MAQSIQTAEVFVKNAFGLQVAVRCTEDAEAISRKNGLSFVELLRPFCQPNSQAQLRDLQGRAYTVRNMRVRFSEPHMEPVTEGKLRLTLRQVVQESAHSDGESRIGQQTISGAGGTVLQYPTPWYDQYREVFLENLKQLDYEYLRHYVCVMLVVSSRHPKPVEGFQELYKVQKEAEKAQYPKWLTPNLYYYHILLHDATEGSSVPAQESYDRVRSAYGSAVCQLLTINSKQPETSKGAVPDPWRQYVRMPPMQGGEDDGVAPKVQFNIGGKKLSPAIMDSNAVAPPPREIVLKPSEVREEPMLIDLDSEPAPSFNSSNVELGSDPLTQLRVAEPSYSLMVQSGSGNLSSSNESIVSGSQLLDRVGSGSHRAVGQCLSLSDHNTLRTFVQEFLFSKLVPHMDSVLRKLNETYSNRHGGMQRLFSKFRKASSFAGGASSSPSQGAEDVNHDSAELQARLVGDLAFLLHNYEAAYSLYNTARKGFSHSAVCYAGALEMGALSAFMMSSNKKEVIASLEDAHSSYLNTVKSTSLALRTVVLLSEVLKERGMYRELTQLILTKMTSSEDDDVRNALFLEQVAHAFLHTRPPMVRKYAFHMVLASHRYYRAMQRIHSRRVLRHALDVYSQKGWSLAEDFIGFSLARYSFSLHKLDDASAFLELLLSHECSQSPQQQLTNLKEYVFVQKQRLNSSASLQQLPFSLQSTTLANVEQMAQLPSLPVPLIKTSCTAVTFATGVDHAYLSRLVKRYAYQSRMRSTLSEEFPPGEGGGHGVGGYSPIMPHRVASASSSEGDFAHFDIGTCTYSPHQSEISMLEREREWHSLEAGASGQKEHTFRSTVLYLDNTTTTDNSYVPMCIVNEPVAVSLVFKNQLQVMLNMVRISLLWRFTEQRQTGGVGAATEVIERLILEPGEERPVTFHVTPLKEGTVEVVGVVYTLTVQDAQLPGDSPAQAVTKTTLPSLNATAKDSIYERSSGLSVQSVLSEGIQGKLLFAVRGQRLNVSKLERCATMYGPDYRLKWTVAEPQPKIVASLTGLSSWSLIGQVTRLNLEVINCGHAPLESLRLASSLSNHILLETDPQLQAPFYSYQPSVGGCSLSPSPGHHHVPPGMTIPLPDGCLHPGQRVSASLLLHSPESVRDVPCNMVFCYRKLGASNGSSVRYRILRHTCTLKVRDSLQVRAFALHSYVPVKALTNRADLNNLLITLEVENRCQVNAAIEIQVLQVSSVSDNWRIEKVDPNQSVLNLLPGMGGLIHLKATRVSDVVPSPKSLWYTDVPLGPNMVNSNQFPASNFFYSSEAYQLLGAEGKPSVPTCDLALIVLWQACVPNGADVVYSYGQHSVGVELPQSMASLSSAPVPIPGALTPPVYDMVKYILDHPSTHHHNFSNCAVCRVPVKLVVQNCCKARLEVSVQFVPVRDSTNQSLQFLWSGSTASRRIIELEPNATRTISVFANFTTPGVYNLNSLQVEATVAGSTDLFIQRRQRASYITVME